MPRSRSSGGVPAGEGDVTRVLRCPHEYLPVVFDPGVRRESRVCVACHAHAQRRTVSVAAKQEAGGERLSQAIVTKRDAAPGHPYGPADALGGVPGRRSGGC